MIKQNFEVMKGPQKLLEDVLNHLKIDFYEPVLPEYHLMSASSVRTLLNQTYYASLAKKLGAPLPKSYSAKSGSALENNAFLHGYNNEILRSIAKKLELQVPAPIGECDSLSLRSNKVLSQNHEILQVIATKLGVE